MTKPSLHPRDREPSELLADTLNYLPVGISIIDAEMRLVLSNTRLRELLNLPEELTRSGTPLEAIVRFGAARGDYGKGAIDKVVRERMALSQRAERHRIERTIQGRVVEIHGNPLPDGGFITIYSDITELREAERISRESEQRFREAHERLEESEGQLRTILQASPIGIAIAETERGRIRFSNAHFGRLMGLRASEVAQRALHEFFVRRSDWSTLQGVLDADGEVLDREVELKHASGRIIHALITIRTMPFEEEGALYTWIYDISEQARSREQQAQLARLDDLTGLSNRRAFHDELRRHISYSRRKDQPLALLYLDLDGFKAVNDSLGHEAGDEVLREVGQRLRRTLREEDIVARVGGDEFAVLMIDGADTHSVERVALKLIETISGPYTVSEGRAELGVSVGIAHYEPTDEDVESLVNRADKAMYRAKRHGKGHYVVWSSDIARI